MFKQNALIYIVIFILLTVVSCNSTSNEKLSTDIVNNPTTASGEESRPGLPKFQFDKEKHDFGKVIQGEVVTFAFKFENIGQSDLLIATVTSSCGCTVTKYSKEPIAPGEKGSIQVTFNSSGRKGYQSKSVSIMANTQPSRTILKVEARIKEPGK